LAGVHAGQQVFELLNLAWLHLYFRIIFLFTCNNVFDQ